MGRLSKEDNLRFLPPAAKYFKRLKDKTLKRLYQKAIEDILDNLFIGNEKLGDLKGLRGYDIYYNKTNYELAYTIEYVRKEDDDDEPVMVIVVLAGTRENFSDQVKRYWN